MQLHAMNRTTDSNYDEMLLTMTKTGKGGSFGFSNRMTSGDRNSVDANFKSVQAFGQRSESNNLTATKHSRFSSHHGSPNGEYFKKKGATSVDTVTHFERISADQSTQ